MCVCIVSCKSKVIAVWDRVKECKTITVIVGGGYTRLIVAADNMYCVV